MLTVSGAWPPAGASQALLQAALQFDPTAVSLYTGLKIVRPGVSNSTQTVTQGLRSCALSVS